MSSPNLPDGAFLTTINGKRCTAIPRAAGNGGGNNNQNNNNGGNQQATATSAPPERNTNVASFSTTGSPPPPPPAQITNIPAVIPPPAQAPAQTQAQSPPQAQISTPPQQAQPPPVLAPVVPPSSSQPPPVVVAPPAAISPPLAASPPPEIQNGENGAGAGAGATAQIPPPSQAPAQPSASLPSSIARASSINSAQAPPPPQPSTGQSSAPAPQIGEADNTNETTAIAAATTQTPQAFSEIAASAPLPSLAAGAESSSTSTEQPVVPQITTIGTARPSEEAAAAGGGPPATNNPAVSAVPQGGNNGGMRETTIAVAGGVVGGVVLISVIAFLIWFLRKKSLRKRRSTLLTPLSIGPGYGPDEKSGAYVINRGSIGPTPRAEKLKASLGYGFQKLKGQFGSLVTRRGSASSGGVNMNRGNSQFMEDGNGSTRSRSGSSATSRRPQYTTKEKLADWWSSLNFKWRRRGGGLGGEKGQTGISSSDPFADPVPSSGLQNAARSRGPAGPQPDFLTLLGMDDRELQREAQRRRASRNGSGSASSGDHFLGSLGLNFNNSSSDDPFSDVNALAHHSAKPAPLNTNTNANGANPFSDANAVSSQQQPAIPKPSTYVADIRRSRGQSVTTTTTAGVKPPPSSGQGGAANAYTRADSFYNRESVNSMDSFEQRRNKFRSDPFDLERPELLQSGPPRQVPSSNVSTAGDSTAPRLSDIGSVVGGGGRGGAATIRKPGNVHRRSDSFSSKYSSGISMGDWSDPGPDVGPAASRWDGGDGGSTTRGDSPVQGRSAGSGGRRSGGSVGKAL